MASTSSTTAEGVIRSLNSHGLRLDGEADWLNYSKFARPEELGQPVCGQRVIATLDKSGFIRKLTEIIAPAPIAGGSEPQQHAQPPAHTGPPALVFDKDLRITRMAAVNSAVNILGHNERTYTLEDVLEMAGQIEAWVTR